ncbi:MAG: acetyl-CoA carboxylase carboxyl transferase subunit alpha, partial [Chitinophagaceae bacterium]
VIPEPLGGAHVDYETISNSIKKVILDSLKELEPLSPEERINNRIEKFSKMGFFNDKDEKK